MENTQIKLSETVMVIDVAYLNFVINLNSAAILFFKSLIR